MAEQEESKHMGPRERSRGQKSAKRTIAIRNMSFLKLVIDLQI